MANTLQGIDDTRIKAIRPVIPPALLMEDFPLTGRAADTGVLFVPFTLTVRVLVCAYILVCLSSCRP
jgi:hypothetical protein